VESRRSVAGLRAALPIILIGVFLGAGYWIADAIYHVVTFPTSEVAAGIAQPPTIWDELILNIPAHRLSLRLHVLALCLLTALGAVVVLNRRRKERQSVERVHSIIANSPVSLFEWRGDEDAPVTFVTENVSRLLGYSAHELLGQEIPIQRVVHPEDLDQVRQEIRAVVEDPSTHRYALSPHRLRTRDGDTRWIDVRGIVYRSPDGRAIRRDEIVIDVTDRKHLEMRLQEQRKLESLGVLAAGIAHEINNPLTGVINYADLIRLRATDDAIGEYATSIMSDGQRIAKTVSSLSTYAQRDFGDKKLVLPSSLIDEVLTLVTPTLRKEQIMVVTEVEDGLPRIMCNHHKVEQVLVNLLVNAREAVNRRFSETEDRRQLAIRAGAQMIDGRRIVRITVEDNGSGIPREIRERIFDPFFSTRSRAEGAGLGLAIGRTIARAHGGDLTYEVSDTPPTRFHLDLPTP